MAGEHKPGDAAQTPADSATDDADLAALRVRIDHCDSQIVKLLAERAGLALEVGEVKARTGSAVYRPEREAAIFRRLRQTTDAAPLGGAALEAVYREIISACREVERRMQVAYLGPPGTFSELAVSKHFGSGVDALPCANIEEVFRATEAGTSDYGVVPVENSTEGAINRTLDLLLATPLTISGEVSVPVHHCLMNLSGETSEIRGVCAHPQALAQCARWLDSNLPAAERIIVSSNAEGARQASKDSSLAAIAAQGAAARYGLLVAGNGVQDVPGNQTRFAIIGKYVCAPSGADQTSLILSAPDKAGAVHRLIEPLARHGVSMKRFESRPARGGTWEYFFYIDLAGHPDEEPVKTALAELKESAAFYRIVGAYPRSSES